MSGNGPGPILEVSREGRVLRLVLNRPEKRNALNGALCQQLVAAIEEGDRDTGVGAILLFVAAARAGDENRRSRPPVTY